MTQANGAARKSRLKSSKSSSTTTINGVIRKVVSASAPGGIWMRRTRHTIQPNSSKESARPAVAKIRARVSNPFQSTERFVYILQSIQPGTRIVTQQTDDCWV